MHYAKNKIFFTSVTSILLLLITFNLISGNNKDIKIEENESLWYEGIHECFTIQVLPSWQCTLKTYYWSDTTNETRFGYIPTTLSLDVNIPTLNGYFHLVPGFLCEFETTRRVEYPLWGVGGKISFEIHPLPRENIDPYIYISYSVIEMSQLDYKGYGYSNDIGFGMVKTVKQSLKMATFVAITPSYYWKQNQYSDFYSGRELSFKDYDWESPSILKRTGKKYISVYNFIREWFF